MAAELFEIIVAHELGFERFDAPWFLGCNWITGAGMRDYLTLLRDNSPLLDGRTLLLPGSIHNGSCVLGVVSWPMVDFFWWSLSGVVVKDDRFLVLRQKVTYE